MTIHFTFAVVISAAMLVTSTTASFSKMFAAQNRAGLPSGLLVETTDLSNSEQVDKLLSQLESPEFQKAVRQAALQQSVDTSRDLSEDWEDPILCQHDWLSWVPWLNCFLDTHERQVVAPPLFFQEEGECYREL